MDLEELASVNSELRFLTIELMKIASQRGVSFDEILSEFTQNAFKLDSALKSISRIQNCNTVQQRRSMPTRSR
ncbi:MAG: hypothetical protein ACE5DI_06000 [Candidatus Micrarchaeia archaeon]